MGSRSNKEADPVRTAAKPAAPAKNDQVFAVARAAKDLKTRKSRLDQQIEDATK